jgi:hypothetical protein
MRVRPPLVLALAFAVAAGGAAPAPGGRGGQAASAPGLIVLTSGDAKASRIEFRGGGGTVVSQDARELRLRFSQPGPADLSRIVVRPPPWLQGASPRRGPDGLELTLTIAEGAQARAVRTPEGLVVTLAQAAPAAAPTAVRLSPEQVGAAVALRFDFAAPTGAAVFRRGEAALARVRGLGAARSRRDPALAPWRSRRHGPPGPGLDGTASGGFADPACGGHRRGRSLDDPLGGSPRPTPACRRGPRQRRRRAAPGRARRGCRRPQPGRPGRRRHDHRGDGGRPGQGSARGPKLRRDGAAAVRTRTRDRAAIRRPARGDRGRARPVWPAAGVTALLGRGGPACRRAAPGRTPARRVAGAGGPRRLVAHWRGRVQGPP